MVDSRDERKVSSISTPDARIRPSASDLSLSQVVSGSVAHSSSGPEPRILGELALCYCFTDVLGATSLSSIQAPGDNPQGAGQNQAFDHFRVSQGYLYTARPYVPAMERTMLNSRISLDLLASRTSSQRVIVGLNSLSQCRKTTPITSHL